MQLNPYLFFNGECEAAFRFYEKVLGGKICVMMTYGESPEAAKTPDNMRKSIIHARMTLGDKTLMGSDAPPERFEAAKGFSINIGAEQPVEAERIFAALAKDGTIRMPIAETFWALRFGMLVDQFGVPWMINCEKPM